MHAKARWGPTWDDFRHTADNGPACRNSKAIETSCSDKLRQQGPTV